MVSSLELISNFVQRSLIVAAVCGGIYFLTAVLQIGKRPKGLPPGPPTVPLLGNLHIFPSTAAHLQFDKCSKQYGDIYSLMMGPIPVIVLSSASTFRELMDENSALTSDRAALYMPSLVTPEGTNLSLSRYNNTWRTLRRAAHEILTPKACQKYIPIQHAEASQLMFEFLTQPGNFLTSIRRYSASSSISVLFGKRAPQMSTKEVVDFFHSEELIQKLQDPGSQPPVDLIPVLKYVPEWMGATWKSLVKEARELRWRLFYGLLGELEERNKKGEYNGSCMELINARADEWKLSRKMVAGLGGVLIQGGSETTASFLQTLVLALVAYPEVQTKAQKELDRVVGSDRAPTWEDLEHLPYIRAVINETHRFRPVLPLCVPHSTTGDIEYRGYRIPKGTIIYCNAWSLFHDEEAYENPSVFNPDRFIKREFGTREEAKDEDKIRRNTYAFGLGRRICPGIHLANNSLGMNVANFLWGFNFNKAKDPLTGDDIEVDVWDYTGGLAVQPHPFPCSITPRSEKHAHTIRQQFAEATETFAQFEHQLSEEDKLFVQAQRKAMG